MTGVPASPSGYSAEPEPSCTVSAVPVSIPNALDKLRSATIALIIAVEQDSVADWPGDIDCGHLDRAWDAIDATYPVIWNAEQVAAIEAWQSCGWVHPLTCINRSQPWHKDEDGEEALPIATPNGLVCRSCGYRQMSVPDCVFGPLPPNPAKQFTAQGTEARRAETLKDGSVHDGPVPQGCAQTPSSEQPS